MYNCFFGYQNSERQNAKNTRYPNKVEVQNTDTFKELVSFDHTVVRFKDDYRKIDNFLESNCVMFDVDNAESDDPVKWIHPKDVQSSFPGVLFYVCFSRNHEKAKNGKAARPKFHVYFPIKAITDCKEYTQLKEDVCSVFDYFDKGAKDAARFFFGVTDPQVEFYSGDTLLSEYMEMKSRSQNDMSSSCGYKDDIQQLSFNTEIIPQGTRNSTMISKAAKYLKRWGESVEARNRYLETAKKCVPPLEESELDGIWRSALKYYHDAIKSDPDYIMPEQFHSGHHRSLRPKDFTDVGEAEIFASFFEEKLRYSMTTSYLYYNGSFWEESEIKAHGLVQKFTDMQLSDATSALKAATAKENDAAIREDRESQNAAKGAITSAKRYRNFVLKSRDTRKISAILKEAQPKLEISPDKLDNNPFFLNTPDGTIDLRTGEMHAHNPNDFCTKITKVGVSEDGKELFKSFLNDITQGDTELQVYLQQIAGMCAIGKVFSENLIIAYGRGKNGKSTFFNLLGKVLGSYSGLFPSDALMKRLGSSKNYDIAELRGQRLSMSSELDEDMELNTALVKRLCSTDPIRGEKKYRDPFDFTPSHTLVLVTNHLPAVKTLDEGTWRRIIALPFDAVISSNTDKRDYVDILFKKAGGAVLAWIVEGAKQYCESGYKIEQPKAVIDATGAYREENDWIKGFISECCCVDPSYSDKGGDLYSEYRSFCEKNGEYPKSNSSFKKALVEQGYKWSHTKVGSYYKGLKLRSNSPYVQVTSSDTVEEDFSGEEIKF